MALNPLDQFSRPSPIDLQPPSVPARDLLPGPHFEMLLQGAPTRPASGPPQCAVLNDEPKSAEGKRTQPARSDDRAARPADSPIDRAEDPSAAAPDDASAAAEVQEAQTATRDDQHDEDGEDEHDKKTTKAESTGLEGYFCVMMPPEGKPVNLDQAIVAAEGTGEEAAVDDPLASVGADASARDLRGEIAPLEGQGGVAPVEAAALEAIAPDQTLIALGDVSDQVPIASADKEVQAADANAGETEGKLKQVAAESAPDVAAPPETAADEAAIKTDSETSDADHISQVNGEALGEDSADKSEEESEQSNEPAEARDTSNPAVLNEQQAPQEKTPEPIAAVGPKDSSSGSQSDAISTAPPATAVVDAAPRSSPLRFSAQALAPEGLGGNGPKAHIEVDATRFLHRVTKAFEAAQERGGEIRLRLSPPELGSLRLDVRIQDGALVARLEAETSAAKTVLIENLPALRDRLAEQGIRIERFDVDLMQHQAGGPPDQPQDRSQADHNPFVRAGRPVAAPIPFETSIFAPPSPSGITAEGLNVII